jgi:hypothetical protein
VRRLLAGDPVVVALGLIVGATSIVESWAPIAALAAVALMWVSLHRPAVPIALAFLGILLDAQGLLNVKVLGLPLTLSKVMVAYALASHFGSAMANRRPLLLAMPISTGVAAIVASMMVSLVPSVDPRLGYVDVLGVLMLAFMAHVIYTAVRADDVPWMMRFMAVATLGVLLWTATTQRAVSEVANIELAWWQRPSGAFGDPNAWSTCLLVVCPVVIGWLLADDHPLARPMLLALLALFPFGMVQAISRAGLVAFVVIAPGLLWMLRRERLLLAIAAVALVVVLPQTLDLDAILLRYRTLLDPTLEADLGHSSLAEREGLLRAGVQIFLDHPWTGVGVGMFRMFASYVSAGEVWKIAHNSYVNVAAEQGLQGLATHAFFGWQVVVGCWNVWNRSGDDVARSLGFGLCLSGVAFAAMAFTLNLATFAVAWYVLAVGLAVGRHAGAEEAVAPWKTPQPPPAPAPRAPSGSPA